MYNWINLANKILYKYRVHLLFAHSIYFTLLNILMCLVLATHKQRYHIIDMLNDIILRP
jgi:hypothetical protein